MADTMIITCPTCATKYNVPEGAVNEEGRVVRCRSCSFEWRAVPDDAPSLAAKEGQTPSGEMAETEPDVNSPRADSPKIDIESAAQSRRETQKDQARGDKTKYLKPALAIAASLLITVGSLYGLRNSIVSLLPVSASVYKLAGITINLVGFDFENVKVVREFDGGMPILTVSGEVINITDEPLTAPRVRFGLRDAAKQEIYHWTVAVSDEALPSGARAKFSTKLAAPPKEAREVLLRFNSLTSRRQAFLFTSPESK